MHWGRVALQCTLCVCRINLALACALYGGATVLLGPRLLPAAGGVGRATGPRSNAGINRLQGSYFPFRLALARRKCAVSDVGPVLHAREADFTNRRVRAALRLAHRIAERRHAQ